MRREAEVSRAQMGSISHASALLRTLQIENAVGSKFFPKFFVYQLLISVPTVSQISRSKVLLSGYKGLAV